MWHGIFTQENYKTSIWEGYLWMPKAENHFASVRWVLRRRITTTTGRTRLTTKLLWCQLSNIEAWNWGNSKPEGKYRVSQTHSFTDWLELVWFMIHSEGSGSGIQSEDRRIDSEPIRREEGESANDLFSVWIFINHLIMENEKIVVCTGQRPFDWTRLTERVGTESESRRPIEVARVSHSNKRDSNTTLGIGERYTGCSVSLIYAKCTNQCDTIEHSTRSSDEPRCATPVYTRVFQFW